MSKSNRFSLVCCCCCSFCDDRSSILLNVTRNKKYLPLWERVVKIKPKSVHAKICSLHFKEKDFVEGRGSRVLKPGAVPSVNIVNKDSSTDDDDDNEKLSLLKRALSRSKGDSTTTGRAEKTTRSDSDEYDQNPNLPQKFQMVVPCTCCNSVQSSSSFPKQTSNMGVQTKIKTNKEISLQAKVKLLELRLRRRDAKISYMQTVLNMIKKHTKGTDMEYKLCCELQNISQFSETIDSSHKDKRKSNRSKTRYGRVESPVSEVSIGDEDACTFYEVVHSPNLKTFNGFS
ncbi:uncharacterized protein LOC133533644 isoform X2 [Cydia pomonella]|uniref:uncharacterized protein LOC133533644 isoform X2 n=1 Tax=Cydia pomonella TaxID=82600 RepID=UPI002ADDBA37|nr:uncharacterized protein LOC133533644 isoform X2 [Cydia pomonella]